MAKFANELLEHIIRPTLAHLGVDNLRAEYLLLTIALLSSRFRADDDRLGMFCISPQQHRQIWDDYLAFNPDLASEVRALASQRWFLENPDRELIANVAYASAITWMLFSISGMALPAADDTEGQAQVWQRLIRPEEKTNPAFIHDVAEWVRERLHETRLLPPVPRAS